LTTEAQRAQDSERTLKTHNASLPAGKAGRPTALEERRKHKLLDVQVLAFPSSSGACRRHKAASDALSALCLGDSVVGFRQMRFYGFCDSASA
jgi:hypothetical protein